MTAGDSLRPVLTRLEPDAAAFVCAVLRELETTSAALELLTTRFAELARERDELVLQLAERRERAMRRSA